MIKAIIGNNMNRNEHDLSENTTIRQALEAAHIDYTRGTTSLDGATLAPGQMDKTFAEMGITEKCYLLNVVKADNAAVIKIVGGAAVVEASFTPEELQEVEKFRPEALKLYEGEGSAKKVTYSIWTYKDKGGNLRGNGVINKVGAEFGENKTEAGKAAITLLIPEGKDPKKWVEENIGVAILKLQKIEDQFAPAQADAAAEHAAVRAAITVM